MAGVLARVTGVINGATVTLLEIDLELEAGHDSVTLPLNYPITVDPVTNIVLTTTMGNPTCTATATIGIKEDLI